MRYGDTGEEAGRRLVDLLLLPVEAGDMVVEELIFEKQIGVKGRPLFGNAVDRGMHADGVDPDAGG